MNVTNFLSEGIYLKLPPGNNPKVYLSINNKNNTELSFQLYNPFSLRAKTLKFILRILFTYFNNISKKIIPTVKVANSPFINFLNKKLNVNLRSSIYIATAKDKYVLQLIRDNEIFGYLKFPLNEYGKERLLNEQKAISILSNKGIVPRFILMDKYKSTDFLVLKDLKGSIGDVTKKEYSKLLGTFKKESKHLLRNHPRVSNIKKDLIDLNLDFLLDVLNNVLSSSKTTYYEVLEHGDFAPWNLMRTDDQIIPFDFEYFEEVGLEYLDECKYHFQVQRLLNKKSGKVLVAALKKELALKEFNLLFKVFLIKEIILKHKENLPYDFEVSIINILNNEKA